MNFIFQCSTRYLTSERSERVRYRVEHEKIKFISTSGHVIFCLLYEHRINSCEKGAIYYVTITTVISSRVKMYGLLTKCEVKMAGYWPSSFFCVFLDRDEVEVHKLAKKERGQYPDILTEQTWSIKDLLYGF